MNDHERIWLEPEDTADEEYGRQWMHKNVWGDEATEYVRADLVDKMVMEALTTTVPRDGQTPTPAPRLAGTPEASTLGEEAEKIVANLRPND